MQIEQNTLWIIGAVVVIVLLLLIIANVRRRPARPTAPAARTHARDPMLTTGDVSVEIRLSRLADLRSKGLVTEEEYEGQRKKILGEL